MSPEAPDDVNWLFAQAAIDLDSDDIEGDLQRITGWSAVQRLHTLGTKEALEAAIAATREPDALRRRIGAAVLGQLGYQTPGRFADERYHALAALLADERAASADPAVLNDVCFALGHLKDARAIPALLDLRHHPDPDVRYGVVHGLSCHEDDKAIEGLIELSADGEDHIRDWATFGLAQLIPTDTPAIRAALRARLDDPHFETRNEAIAGLAERRDETVVPVLIRELHQQVGVPLLDAAEALADPLLCEALVAAKAGGLAWEANGQKYDLTEHWRAAMAACGCAANEDQT